MRNYLIGIVVLIILLAACYAVSLVPKTPSSPQTVSAVFSCNEGKSIRAVFHNGEPKAPEKAGQPPIPTGSVDVVLSDGRSMTLAQTISADGVRYANPDESFVFWNKGNGALVLENNEQKSYLGCVLVKDVPEGSPLSQVYSNGSDGFSIRTPQGFVRDEAYVYQASPEKTISGVQFKIPASVAEGTNLASDSYLSVESIPQNQNCTADLFLDGTHQAAEKTDGDMTYSYVESSGAGAGNRYEETIYALPGTNPCMAVRYMVHYGVIQNYPEGTVKEFDKAALLKQFDEIRRTLVVNQ